MTVESSQASAHGHKPVGEAKQTKGKTGFGADSPDATGGDFMAILATLDQPMVRDLAATPGAPADPVPPSLGGAAGQPVVLGQPTVLSGIDLGTVTETVADLTAVAPKLTPSRETGAEGGADSLDQALAVSELMMSMTAMPIADPALPGPTRLPTVPASQRPSAAIVLEDARLPISPALDAGATPSGPVLPEPTAVSNAPIALAGDSLGESLTTPAQPVDLSGRVAADASGIDAGAMRAPAGVARLIADKSLNATGAATAKVSAAAVPVRGVPQLDTELAGKTSKLQREMVSKETLDEAIVLSGARADEGLDTRSTTVLSKVAAEIARQPFAATIVPAPITPLAHREESSRERGVFKAGLSELGGATSSWFSSAPNSTFQMAPQAAVAGEQQIAEKVAYWITSDVQNAELTLDGLGADPVEVSIRMQGNEAHVAFRTDELQARAALENASIHLKEMLQREGLVLSGVSVGTAGTGEGGSEGRKQKNGARQTVVASAIPPLAEKAVVNGRKTGNALDLFV